MGSPKIRFKGKGIAGKGNSLCKGLDVSKRKGRRKRLVMKFEFDFVFQYFTLCSIHIQRQPAPLYLVPTWMTPGPQRQLPRLGGHTDLPVLRGRGGPERGREAAGPRVVWERAVEPTGRWGISGGH